jgi:hypothetical protein
MFNQSTEYFCHHEAINQACDCYEMNNDVPSWLEIPAEVDNAAESFFWKE